MVFLTTSSIAISFLGLLLATADAFVGRSLVPKSHPATPAPFHHATQLYAAAEPLWMLAMSTSQLVQDQATPFWQTVVLATVQGGIIPLTLVFTVVLQFANSKLDANTKELSSDIKLLESNFNNKLSNFESNFNNKLLNFESNFDNKLSNFDNKLSNFESNFDIKRLNGETKLSSDMKVLSVQIASLSASIGDRLQNQDDKIENIKGEMKLRLDALNTTMLHG
jgi:hypothetical protein